MSETVYAGQSTIQASLFQSVSNTANVQTFTGPGQWIRPAFGTSVTIECWGAGGGGAASNVFSATVNTSGGGGGGGSYASNTFPINFFSSTPVAYVFVGVGGAGGTGLGPPGAGGLGGQSNVSLANDSGVAAFIRGWGGNGADAVTANPVAASAIAKGGGGAGLLGPTTYQNTGQAPVGTNAVAAGPLNYIYSGSGGGPGRTPAVVAPGIVGGAAIFGGGGGGGGSAAPTAPLGGPPGPSIYGGAGGTGGFFNNTTAATIGGARGGGGGGAGISTTVPGSFAGGQGGRGEVRIFVF